ncbi:hypothetical protein GGR56DRAFT_695129 [Xylariaceae sp. FL0804]|nr:hypothetical protein GGR56DRAFT_695129 [Xylariaceae sp. FL0804]
MLVMSTQTIEAEPALEPLVDPKILQLAAAAAAPALVPLEAQIPPRSNLLSLLRQASLTHPHNGLLMRDVPGGVGFESLSFARLWDLAMTNAPMLLDCGLVAPGRPVLLFFERHRDNFVWYWSVIAAGGIPALLPPMNAGESARRKQLDHFSQLFGHPHVLTTTASAVPFAAHGGFDVVCTDKLSPEYAPQGKNSRRSLQLHDWADQDDATCTILFTSGSTGPSKAVRFTHRQLLASSELKCAENKMTHDDNFLCWTSFDHSVAICELHLQALCAGANMFVVPPAEFSQDPLRFWQMLSERRIAYTFAPNSFLASATRAHEQLSSSSSQPGQQQHNDAPPAYDFSRLKVLFCGGEANKTSTLSAAAAVLCAHGAPATAVTAVYGLSETCSALFYNRRGPAGDLARGYAFASVGQPLPGHELRLVGGGGNDGRPSSSSPTEGGGEVIREGAVQLRGPMVFPGYWNDAAATAACFTAAADDDDGGCWFDTGDLGRVDEQGSLVIVGRSKEVLVLNGENYSSGDLEYAVEAAGIAGLEPGFTASFSVWSDAGDSEEIVILFHPAGGDGALDDRARLGEIVRDINRAVVGFCRKRPGLVAPLPRSKLPKSSIGKLSRSALKASLLAGEFNQFKLAPETTSQSGGDFATSQQRTIARVFTDRLGIPESELSADLPIETLGIDSLAYLRLKMGIEQALSLPTPLSVTQLLACRTIREIDSATSQTVQQAAAAATTTTTPTAAETASSSYCPVKVLRPDGPRTPLILCPPANGGILMYTGLFPLLPERRVLALCARGVEAGERPFATLDEMLDAYLAGIRAHQPRGPYALLGLCFGGVVAFELAKRLEAAGESVLFCGGLDGVVDVSIAPDDVDERDLVGSVLEATGALDGEEYAAGGPAFAARLAAAGVAPEDAASAAAELLGPARLAAAGLEDGARLHGWTATTMATRRLARGYAARGTVRGGYDAFHTGGVPRGTHVPDAASWRYVYVGAWARHVAGARSHDVCFDYDDADATPAAHRAGRPALRIRRIQGRHETMTARENVASLGRIVDAALRLREDEWARWGDPPSCRDSGAAGE